MIPATVPAPSAYHRKFNLKPMPWSGSLSLAASSRLPSRPRSKIPDGNAVRPLPCKIILRSAVVLSKMPAGREVRSLNHKFRYVSDVRLSKMPAGNAVRPLLPISSSGQTAETGEISCPQA